jgi:HD-GYP domain-containing protein (c-di-GMP phosphodiesterase class II)
MPIEAQILKVASDYQKMIEPTYQNLFKDKALDTIIEKSDRDYNFQVVQALKITIEKFSLMAVEEQINFIRCMNIALDCKDNHYTMDHCRDTGMMAKKIAERMEIQKDEMDTLLLASELHDVGKIHIKAEILNAPRKLTSEEFEIMMKHAQWSSLFFQEIPGMERISDIIKHHHEKCNGTGYPDNLKSENIPYLSKILTVADIYSALTTPRIYRIDTEGKRESKSLKETLSIMDAMNLQGDFDPEIYKVFSQIINEKISGNNESVKQIN